MDMSLYESPELGGDVQGHGLLGHIHSLYEDLGVPEGQVFVRPLQYGKSTPVEDSPLCRSETRTGRNRSGSRWIH